jgi:hypothetical protein
MGVKTSEESWPEDRPASGRIASEGLGAHGHHHQDPERRGDNMLLATNYPILNIFWSLLEFFLFFIWIWLAFMVFADIFRSHDMGGAAKALWVIFIVVLPYLGVFVYLLFRGGDMHERAAVQAALEHKMFNQNLRHFGNRSSTADQLHELADLKDRGFITDAEFQAEKAKILA